MTRQILRAVTIAAMAFVSGCTTVERVPFTGAQSAAAAIAGAPDVRFWADLPDAAQRMRPDVPAGQPVTVAARNRMGSCSQTDHLSARIS